MFGLKSKKRIKADSEPQNKADISETVVKVETPDKTETAENSVIEVVEKTEILPVKDDDKSKKPEKLQYFEDYSDFSRLAEILCKDEKTVLEECKLFQIKKIMSRLSKAVVRYGLSGEELKPLVKNTVNSGLGEIAVSPAYLKDLADNLKRAEEIKVCAVVDFPFGESTFKVKLSEIKNSVKKGVDGVLTVVNSSAIKKENAAALKKQLKKIGKIKKAETGVAVSAEDTAADDIKRFLRFAEKADLKYAAFLFGNVSKSELDAKMKEINGYKGKIAVKIMANVENAEGVKALIGNGADGIITPYADDIAKELFSEFKIKSVKLV